MHYDEVMHAIEEERGNWDPVQGRSIHLALDSVRDSITGLAMRDACGEVVVGTVYSTLEVSSPRSREYVRVGYEIVPADDLAPLVVSEAITSPVLSTKHGTLRFDSFADRDWFVDRYFPLAPMTRPEEA